MFLLIIIPETPVINRIIDTNKYPVVTYYPLNKQGSIDGFLKRGGPSGGSFGSRPALRGGRPPAALFFPLLFPTKRLLKKGILRVKEVLYACPGWGYIEVCMCFVCMLCLRRGRLPGIRRIPYGAPFWLFIIFCRAPAVGAPLYSASSWAWVSFSLLSFFGVFTFFDGEKPKSGGDPKDPRAPP